VVIANHRIVKIKKAPYTLFILPDIPQWFVTDSQGENAAAELLNVDNKASKLMLTENAKEERLSMFEYFNRKLQKLEWASRNETKKLILKTLDVEVTSACNLRCLYCYNNSGLKTSNELSMQEFKDVFYEARQRGVDTLTISGGEPFMRKDLSCIVNSAKDLGIQNIQILTNGTLIKSSDIKWIRDLRITLQVSLDGSTASINDIVRGKGTYKRIIKTSSSLQKNDIKMGLSCTILKPNLQDLPRYLNIAEKFGVKFVRLGLPTLMGRALKNRFLIPSVRELIKYFRGVFTYLENAKIRPLGSIRILEIWNLKGRISNILKRTRCAGNFGMLISSEGNIFPCFNLCKNEFLAGNVRKDSIEQVFRNSPIFRQCRKNRVDRITKCAACEIKYFCGGGCAGRAFEYNRDMYTSDPLCPVLKSIFLNSMFSVAKYVSSSHNLILSSKPGGSVSI